MSKVAIIGASGALGQAFTKVFEEDSNVETIYGCSRRNLFSKSKKFKYISLDLEDELSIANAADTINTHLDLVLICSGILHTEDIKPEKSLKELSMANLNKVLSINMIGSALVIKHFYPLLKKDKKTVFAIISARVGSISDNRLGGWYSYRASKAALNMIIKTASIELKRLNKKAIIIGLHPGTVDSALSKPYQTRIPQNKLFTADFSAKKLLEVIAAADETYSGYCYDYNKLRIDF